MKLRQWLPFKKLILVLGFLTIVMPAPVNYVAESMANAPHICACHASSELCACDHLNASGVHNETVSSGCSAETAAGQQAILRNRVNEWAVLFAADSFTALNLSHHTIFIVNQMRESITLEVELEPPKSTV